MEDGLLRLNGAQGATDKYTSLATIKFIGGLQTQRSIFTSIATRYDTKYLGGKPDALTTGVNTEISNSLTLQRRPGLIAYGVSLVPQITTFFDWQLATTTDIILVLDTATGGGDNNVGANGGVLNYSPTHSGIYINKAVESEQTNFLDVVNTLYLGDGVDLYKITGPNLLNWSNTFTNSIWTKNNATLTPGQVDPLDGTTATEVTWTTTGPTANIQQSITPNYTPIASNTFTFSLWMEYVGGAETVSLEIADQSGSITSTAFALTSSWVKYQITGTMGGSSNVIKVLLINPNSTNSINIYGAQLEIGGPATTTQITDVKPQGVWLWGIQAPATAPTFTLQSATGNTGMPWLANHQYDVGDTVVDTNGNLEYATNGGIYPELDLTLTSVDTGTGVYHGSITNGASNRYAGLYVKISGFTNSANNGVFSVTASTSSTLTTTNSSSASETHAAEASFGVPGTIAGTSGATQPNWNVQVGGFTMDGAQSLVVQSVNTPSPSANGTASVTFTSPVTAGDMIMVIIYVSHPQVISVTDTNGNTYTQMLSLGHGGTNPGSSGETRNNAVSSGQFSMYGYFAANANAGATTINISGGGTTGTYVAACEIQNVSAADSTNFNSNASTASNAASFTTGGINTANATDFILTVGAFAVSASAGSGAEIGAPPSSYTIMNTDGPVSIASNTALINVTLAFDIVSSTGFYDPSWTISSPTTKSQNLGLTGSFITNVGTLQWVNLGTNGAGLTATIGYQYYYSYGNSYTGHFSDVSPISASTGKIVGQDVLVTGATRPMDNSGTYSTDPQSDLVAVYRNTDGGGFWYQVALFGNGAAAQAELVAADYPGLTTSGITYSGSTWTYTDTTPDATINTAIFAPIGLLNDLPPAGLKDLEYFAGRVWGSVSNLLYYCTSADNASLLNVQQNGVPAESWVPTNYIPFNSAITRILAVGGGLLVVTTTDTWFVTGQNLLTGGFNPQKELAGHGLRSYNAVGLDGSSVYLYTSDREMLCINPNSGSIEIGFAIGDYLEENFLPEDVYLTRHIAGSRDNAVFIADGATGWFRLNPNQQGASMSGEQTPVFSPKADFTTTINGIGAIASIETSAGVHQLLVAPQVSQGGSPPIVSINNNQTTTVSNWSTGQSSFTMTVTPSSHIPSVAINVGDVGFLMFIVEPTSDGASNGVTTVTDSNGNTWSQLGETQVPIPGGFLETTYYVQIFYARMNTQVTTSDSLIITVNLDQSSNITAIPFPNFMNVANLVTSSPLAIKQAIGTGANPVSGSITTSGPTVLLSFALSDPIGSPSLTVPSGWTDTGIAELNRSPVGWGAAWIQENSNGTYTDQWSAAAPPINGGWSATFAAFLNGQSAAAPVLVRDLDTFSDIGTPYPWSSTVGSILLSTPGKLAETSSITTEMNQSEDEATQCGVSVLLDEISGTFESLPVAVNDPPQLFPSETVLSNRFYLSQSAGVPTCRHMQVQLTGQAVETKDELLSLTIIGALVPEEV